MTSSSPRLYLAHPKTDPTEANPTCLLYSGFASPIGVTVGRRSGVNLRCRITPGTNAFSLSSCTSFPVDACPGACREVSCTPVRRSARCCTRRSCTPGELQRAPPQRSVGCTTGTSGALPYKIAPMGISERTGPAALWARLSYAGQAQIESSTVESAGVVLRTKRRCSQMILGIEDSFAAHIGGQQTA